MQYNIKNIGIFSDIERVNFSFNNTDFCSPQINRQSSLEKKVFYPNISIDFNLIKNLSNYNIKNIEVLKNYVDTEGIATVVLTGVKIELPLVNNNFNEYVMANLSSNQEYFTGIRSYSDNILVYWKEVKGDEGIKYTVNFNEKKTYVEYNINFNTFSLDQIIGGYAEVQLFFVDQRDLYIFRGPLKDINFSFELIYNSINSLEIWEQ